MFRRTQFQNLSSIYLKYIYYSELCSTNTILCIVCLGPCSFEFSDQLKFFLTFQVFGEIKVQ